MLKKLLNQLVEVNKRLAIALLLRAPRSDIVDLIGVGSKIHQTL
jgi:hypothetical protein